MKILKSCSGYPNEWDLTFRSENKKVQARLQASQGVASQDSGRHPASHSLHTRIQHSVIQHKRNHERVLNLSRVLRDDSEVHAIRLFFQDYMKQALMILSSSRLCSQPRTRTLLKRPRARIFRSKLYLTTTCRSR